MDIKTYQRRNVYMCPKCGKGFVSEDIDQGTTPFMVNCLTDGCDGKAESFCYKAPAELLSRYNPAVEFYKPTYQERKKMTHAMQQHVSKGGLAMRIVVD